MSNSQSVYITARASKVGSAPLALPSTVRPLTQAAINLAKSNGRRPIADRIAAFGSMGWGVRWARGAWSGQPAMML